MLPPPVTPKKKKIVDALSGSPPTTGQDREMLAAVHDSGGSIIDVPTTPKQRSHAAGMHDGILTPGTPSQQQRYEDDFDDGTSPTKLRNLIASFAATRSRLTPTKSLGIKDDDEQLRRGLRKSRQNHNAMQSSNAFTPRTKARKRLRGEVVVTPAKAQSYDGQERAATAQDLRPTKKQRGTGSLRAFGFTTRSSQSQGLSGSVVHDDRELDMSQNEDSDDDEDLVGPSPSTQRIVNMPVDAFKPLFSQHVLNGHEEEADEEYVPLRSSQSAAVEQTETAMTTPPPATEERVESDSDQEERRVIRQYQRYDSTLRPSAADDEDCSFGGNLLLNRRQPRAESPQPADWPLQSTHDAIGIDRLTLRSPQCKRAQRQRRRMQAENVRKLLHFNGVDLSESEDETVDGLGPSTAQNHEAPQKSIAHNDAKTARMMHGTLTKTARKKLAMAEAAEEAQGIEKAGSVEVQRMRVKPQKKEEGLILRRGREDDNDEDADYLDECLEDELVEGMGKTYRGSDDEEWASDVDSAEYGLGDGYMDEVDVV
jgi:hypothetical protein